MASGKKKHLNFISFVIFSLIIIGFVLYIIWFVLSGNSQVPNNYQLGNFRLVDQEFLQNVKEFKFCGNWPINVIKTDNQRTNPFSRKNLQISPMAASSIPECLPFNQR